MEFIVSSLSVHKTCTGSNTKHHQGNTHNNKTIKQTLNVKKQKKKPMYITDNKKEETF